VVEILVDFGDGEFGIVQKRFLFLVQAERGGNKVLICSSPLEVFPHLFDLPLIETHPVDKIGDIISWFCNPI
jgi:hypothetical protein